MIFYLFLIANPVSRTIVLATSPHPELPQVLTFYALTIAVDLEVDVEKEVVHDALLDNLQILWGHLIDGHIYTQGIGIIILQVLVGRQYGAS